MNWDDKNDDDDDEEGIMDHLNQYLVWSFMCPMLMLFGYFT